MGYPSTKRTFCCVLMIHMFRVKIARNTCKVHYIRFGYCPAQGGDFVSYLYFLESLTACFQGHERASIDKQFLVQCYHDILNSVKPFIRCFARCYLRTSEKIIVDKTKKVEVQYAILNKLIIEQSDSLRRKVLNFLREKILDGSLAPDERLIETRIAREMGVSRTPIREALHNLERERLVKAIPRVGYAVTHMQEEEVEEICEIRVAIEGLAIRRAIERSQVKLTRELKKNIAEQRHAVTRRDLRSYVELDSKFHELNSFYSGSDRILDMNRMLMRHMLRFRTQALYMMETVLKSLRGHEQILKAIEQGDAESAVAMLEKHLNSARDDILYYETSKSEQQCNT